MRILSVVLLVVIAACAPVVEAPRPAEGPGGATRVETPSQAARPISRARADWNAVLPRVMPVAEQLCRAENPRQPRRHCDFEVRLITDPAAPANAYQTIRNDGRPVIAFTTNLLALTQSADEVAFILSHEAAHHIRGHLPRQRQSIMAGAVIFGTLAGAIAGVDSPVVRDAMDIGAFLGSRVYSQEFELEADYVGAFITERAGFDPVRGAGMFARGDLRGGGGFLATHPPSPARLQIVQRAAAEIAAARAAGQTPRPR